MIRIGLLYFNPNSTLLDYLSNISQTIKKTLMTSFSQFKYIAEVRVKSSIIEARSCPECCKRENRDVWEKRIQNTEVRSQNENIVRKTIFLHMQSEKIFVLFLYSEY